jgi:hypothetical protein
MTRAAQGSGAGALVWLLAVLLPAGATAQATCPVAADLARGIIITFEDRAITYQARSPDRVELRVATHDGLLTGTSELAFGLLPLRTRATFADPAIPPQDTVMTYGATDLATLLPPAAGRSFAVAGRLQDTAAGASEEVVITVTAGETAQVTIGDCTLAVLPLSVQHDRPGHSYRAETMYLPELGLSFVARYLFDDLPDGVLTPVAIAPAP